MLGASVGRDRRALQGTQLIFVCFEWLRGEGRFVLKENLPLQLLNIRL